MRRLSSGSAESSTAGDAGVNLIAINRSIADGQPAANVSRKKCIGIDNGDLRETSLLRAEPGEEPFDVPLVIGDRCR